MSFNQYALSDCYIQWPFLSFLLPSLLCSFHFSFVHGTVTSGSDSSSAIRYFFICVLDLLSFFCSLFICTSMEELFCFGLEHYVLGGPYLSFCRFFFCSVISCLLLILLYSFHLHLSTHFLKYFYIFSFYWHYQI